MKYEKIEGLYLIRVREQDENVRTLRFGELEELLSRDERAEIKHVINPISAVTAFLYGPEIEAELKENGYELIPQEKNFRTAD